MIKKLSHMLRLFPLALGAALFVCCLIHDSYAGLVDNSSQAACYEDTGTQYTSNMDSSSATELIDAEIMESMRDVMIAIYKQLSKVFMLGHALVCYAVDLDYTCLEIKVLGITLASCLLQIPNIGLLITGCIIYAVGILLTMSVGMYFIDVCFKIGFAVLMLPVALALWPFPPTKGKIADVLSIIIRNAMTFAFVSVGVAFAVILLTNGMYEDGGWDGFWNAIEDLRSENIADNFSLFSSHTIVVIFCIIFAFKIISSSINKYLGFFFRDNVFGNEAPLNKMGTQMAGFAVANTIKPAASFAADVATHQTGRAISGVGGVLEKLGSSDGRQQLGQSIKQTAGKVTNPFVHPVRTYNSAMRSVGHGVNQGIRGIGSVVQGAANAAHIGLTPPGLFSKDDNTRMNNKISEKFAKWGDKADNFVSKDGSEMLKNMTAEGIAGVKNLTSGNGAPQLTGQQVRQNLHEMRQTAADKTQAAKDAVKHKAQDIAGAAAAPFVAAGEKISNSKAAELYRSADQAPITLSPTRAPQTLFKLLKNPVKTLRKLSAMSHDLKESNAKIIFKSGGQVIIRSFKDAGADVKRGGEKTVSAVGKILQDFGKSFGDNSHRKRNFTSFAEIQAQQEAEEEALEEDRLRNESLYDNQDT